LKVAAIIPAYNEAGRIETVLKAVSQANLPHEIIVVSDGSKDQTAAIARAFSPSVKVIELPYNHGKGAAMCAGVQATDAEIIVFIDADLIGMKSEHVDKIIREILENRADMCIGVFRGGRLLSNAGQRISPYISGQRAMRRWMFDSIPYLAEMRLGVEIAINTWAKRMKARVTRVVLMGVSNTLKESKMGLMKGTAARAKMYAEIGRAMVRTHRKQKGNKNRFFKQMQIRK
jgi:glycosyltransferase involved in cell wall biosynthesis